MIDHIFYKTIEEHTFGLYKKKAFSHSYRVSAFAQSLSVLYDLDSSLCKIMGLYHDIAQFVNHNPFNHAKLSSDMCRNLLKEHVNEDELDIICNAIRNHSDKHMIHDAYREVLKDADLLATYYEYKDSLLSAQQYSRIKKYIEKRDEE